MVDDDQYQVAKVNQKGCEKWRAWDDWLGGIGVF